MSRVIEEVSEEQCVRLRDQAPEGEGEIEEKISSLQQCRIFLHDVVQQNTGLWLLILGMAFFSMMDVAVIKLHKVDPPVTTLQLIIVRMAITFICCMIYMFIAKIPNPILGPKGVRLLLLCRGFGGFFGLFGIYFSLQYLSLSDATVLTFLSPTTTAIAGSIFLGEVFVLRQAVSQVPTWSLLDLEDDLNYLASVVSLAGVVLIARPTMIFGDPSNGHGAPSETTGAERLMAVGLSLLGVLGATLAYISIRAIGQRAHPMHSMVFFSMQCMLFSTIGIVVTGSEIVIPTRVGWLALLLMIGIFGFIAQLLLTVGLARETAGRGTLALYTQILFATILEFVFFHTVPPPLSVAGISMIVISALYIALTKSKQNKEPAKMPDAGLIRRMEDEEMQRGLLSAEGLESE